MVRVDLGETGLEVSERRKGFERAVVVDE